MLVAAIRSRRALLLLSAAAACAALLLLHRQSSAQYAAARSAYLAKGATQPPAQWCSHRAASAAAPQPVTDAHFNASLLALRGVHCWDLDVSVDVNGPLQLGGAWFVGHDADVPEGCWITWQRANEPRSYGARKRLRKGDAACERALATTVLAALVAGGAAAGVPPASQLLLLEPRTAPDLPLRDQVAAIRELLGQATRALSGAPFAILAPPLLAGMLMTDAQWVRPPRTLRLALPVADRDDCGALGAEQQAGAPAPSAVLEDYLVVAASARCWMREGVRGHILSWLRRDPAPPGAQGAAARRSVWVWVIDSCEEGRAVAAAAIGTHAEGRIRIVSNKAAEMVESCPL